MRHFQCQHLTELNSSTLSVKQKPKSVRLERVTATLMMIAKTALFVMLMGGLEKISAKQVMSNVSTEKLLSSPHSFTAGLNVELLKVQKQHMES